MDQALSILLVDDDEHIAQMLEESIRQWYPKVDIDKVSNGRAAFEKIKSRRYHFMITDFKMPVMDGGTLLRSLKNLDYRMVPKNIVVLSSYLEPGEPAEELPNVTFIDKMEYPAKLEPYLCSRIKILRYREEKDLESIRVTPWRDGPIRVDISREDSMEIYFVKDISLKGIGVKLKRESSIFTLGGMVDLVISFPDQTTIKVKGRIIHRGSPYSKSMGIEFSHLGTREREVICGYIDQMLLDESK